MKAIELMNWLKDNPDADVEVCDCMWNSTPIHAVWIDEKNNRVVIDVAEQF